MVVLNGLNGTETYQEIVSLNPNQKAIIVSGYAEDHIRDEIDTAKKLGASLNIRKLYTFQDFGRALKSELHGHTVLMGFK